MNFWLLALLASSQVPYELLALVTNTHASHIFLLLSLWFSSGRKKSQNTPYQKGKVSKQKFYFFLTVTTNPCHKF